MNEAMKISRGLVDAGLVNNPKFCISEMGSTFACVCPKCIEKFNEEYAKLKEMWE